jgi:hypothetical protein
MLSVVFMVTVMFVALILLVRRGWWRIGARRVSWLPFALVSKGC